MLCEVFHNVKRARNIGKNHNAICIWSWDKINQNSEKAKNMNMSTREVIDNMNMSTREVIDIP